MSRTAPLLLVLALALSGCTGGQGSDARIVAGEGIVVNETSGAFHVGLAQNATLRSVQVCAGPCDEVSLPEGLAYAERGFATSGNASVNARGPDRDSALYFFDGGEETGRFLRWSDVQSRFVLNADVLTTGNVTATGHVGTITPLDVPGVGVVTITTAALEGIERAIYARGIGLLKDGAATITLPDAFVALALEGTLTVQVTAMDADLGLYVAEKDLAGIQVRGDPGANGSFDWSVQAARKGNEGYSP